MSDGKGARFGWLVFGLSFLLVATWSSLPDTTVGGEYSDGPGGVSAQWDFYATPSKEIFTSISHLPRFSQVTVANGESSTSYVRLKASFDGYAPDFDQSLSIAAYSSTRVDVNPAWNTKVASLQSARLVTLKVTLTDAGTGELLYTASQHYQLLPPTFFAWVLDGDDMRILSPVYVTPNAAFISDVLRAAAARTPWGDLRGYQEVRGYSHQEITEHQMRAVWDVLQDQGFRYVNAPQAYTSTTAQNIKFPSATYQDKTGNCIELVVLLASIYEKIGFATNLIYIPGHAWLAVDVWHNDPMIIPLETTMLPASNFVSAYNQGIDKFHQHKNDPGFVIVDVDQTRQLGISPNPWFA